ncbi:unnamed protein product [Leptidea sinapis]|uniref:Uncharacterized protein n=1 Tax=Leptidea sinapis TaxID=189913 RepID=A0A5E4QE29_9NEOP|nr:unnamed protein product [Leptidea sinapis]
MPKVSKVEDTKLNINIPEVDEASTDLTKSPIHSPRITRATLVATVMAELDLNTLFKFIKSYDGSRESTCFLGCFYNHKAEGREKLDVTTLVDACGQPPTAQRRSYRVRRTSHLVTGGEETGAGGTIARGGGRGRRATLVPERHVRCRAASNQSARNRSKQYTSEHLALTTYNRTYPLRKRSDSACRV